MVKVLLEYKDGSTVEKELNIYNIRRIKNKDGLRPIKATVKGDISKYSEVELDKVRELFYKGLIMGLHPKHKIIVEDTIEKYL